MAGWRGLARPGDLAMAAGDFTTTYTNWSYINESCYHQLPHRNTWCNGSASDVRIHGRAGFFSWTFLRPDYFVFKVQILFLSSTFLHPDFFCLQHFSVQFMGRLLSYLYPLISFYGFTLTVVVKKVFLFFPYYSIFTYGTWLFLVVIRDEFA